jgi:hypothetical protein
MERFSISPSNISCFEVVTKDLHCYVLGTGLENRAAQSPFSSAQRPAKALRCAGYRAAAFNLKLTSTNRYCAAAGILYY